MSVVSLGCLHFTLLMLQCSADTGLVQLTSDHGEIHCILEFKVQVGFLNVVIICTSTDLHFIAACKPKIHKFYFLILLDLT